MDNPKMIISLEQFWQGKRVFVTGHTGFKGAWLSIILHRLGANVTGYALRPPTNPSLFELCKMDKKINSILSDIRDYENIYESLLLNKCEIVFHMAAQSLVRESYVDPRYTYETNIIGTVNILEAARHCDSVRAIVIITSDKCYKNTGWEWGYRENDPIGGYDPYSSSKACAELVTSSYRRSFYLEDEGISPKGIATARSGNVIGGGDWAKYRLMPDCMQSLLDDRAIVIRNPGSTRPWQHVIEPLAGYVLLAEKLHSQSQLFSEPWNFGPYERDCRTVEWLVKKICEKWERNATYKIEEDQRYHEAHCLRLDISKTTCRLGWRPRWCLEKAIDKTIEWTHSYKEKKNLLAICIAQIEEYFNGEV